MMHITSRIYLFLNAVIHFFGYHLFVCNWADSQSIVLERQTWDMIQFRLCYGSQMTS